MSGIVNDGYELVPVGDLVPHPRNPRQGDIGAIAESIDLNGFYGAVVAQRSTRHILVGNHRYLASQQAGVREIPVIWVDCDDEAALRILLVDNRTADRSTYDERQLVDALREVFSGEHGLSGTGFDGDDLDDLIKRLNAANDGGKGTDAVMAWGVVIECDSEEEQVELLMELTAESRRVRAMVQI